MLDLGTKAPNFSLLDTVSGKNLSFEDIKGVQGTLVIFTCNHCPYVIHVNSQIVKLAGEYMGLGIGMVAISANDAVNYPEDAPDKMSIVAKVLQLPFPYLYDESQDVARAYDAACTPDFYLFNASDLLVYRGRLDESRPNNDKPLTGKDLRMAMDLMLRGERMVEKQYPSAGCNIKWKST
jgi:peroxiredoxin